jgi:hypothetical protein
MAASMIAAAVPLFTAAALAIPGSDRTRRRVDAVGTWLTLAAALVMPWWTLPYLGSDRFSAFAAIVVAGAAVAPGMAEIDTFGRIARQIVLAGMLLAAVGGQPVLMDAGLAVAVAAGLAPRLPSVWYRVPLAGAALGLVLFGSILPPAHLTSGCAVLGLAALAVAVPALLPLVPLLALRFAGPELMAVGAAGLTFCAAGAVLRPKRDWIALGHASAITLAFGLRTPDAVFAGLILSLLAVFGQAAVALAKGEGVSAAVAAAARAGLPPFGVFPGLALLVLAIGRQSPWLLAAILPSLAALGWSAIARLTPPRIVAADRWAAAWVPVVLALLLGFCLPDAGAVWLRALATEAIR